MSRASTALTAAVALAVGGLAMFFVLRRQPPAPSAQVVEAPAAPTRFDVVVAGRSTVRVRAQRIVGTVDRSSTGTGIVIAPGRILTSLHVVADPDEPPDRIMVGVEDTNSFLHVELERTDPVHDLAILRCAPKHRWCWSLPPLPFAEAANSRVGDAVYALTAGRLESLAVARGMISHRARRIEGVVHLEAAIAVPESASGAPLFDETGRVIGLITTRWRPEATAFALPIELAATILGEASEPSTEMQRLIAEATPISPPRVVRRAPVAAAAPTPRSTPPQPVGELVFDEFHTRGSLYRARFRLTVPSELAGEREFSLVIGQLEVPLGTVSPRQTLHRHSENRVSQSFEYTGQLLGRPIYSGTKVSLKMGDLAADKFLFSETMSDLE